MNKYTSVITFKIDIEAVDRESAEYIAKQALPHHFGFMDGKGGSGKFLRGLTPVVYEQEDEDKQYDSYWRNR
jgi:hypothetical protein